MILATGGTGQSGCIDVDYIAYTTGVIEPKLASAVENRIAFQPNEYMLSQNFPNPFNPSTKIDFALEKKGFVSLKVYDVLGREISTL
ncbi:hypothetical protein JXO59_01340, partial [candidate division KSB1 bacterium]|nr:hypothetical protein [candidate division KSB1 bacterium]